ncbi:serine/threonine protein kinase [Escherichia coli]|nr:serine/threonine protein kinase [Escherichia coli]PPQ50544.1 serine/threonine protein kinase [Escherichia albertii]
MASENLHLSFKDVCRIFLHFCLSWHYPISPKNRKTAINPRHDWLHGRSGQKRDPLCIWLYPQ